MGADFDCQLLCLSLSLSLSLCLSVSVSVSVSPSLRLSVPLPVALLAAVAAGLDPLPPISAPLRNRGAEGHCLLFVAPRRHCSVCLSLPLPVSLWRGCRRRLNSLRVHPGLPCLCGEAARGEPLRPLLRTRTFQACMGK